jgi:hypothetical protein
MKKAILLSIPFFLLGLLYVNYMGNIREDQARDMLKVECQKWQQQGLILDEETARVCEKVSE